MSLLKNTHGTVNCYTYTRCRCEPCRAAKTAYMRANAAHGPLATYPKRSTCGLLPSYAAGCRCAQCLAANAKHVRDWRAAKKSKELVNVL